MLGIFVLQYVFPPVEVVDTPLVPEYDSDTLKRLEVWLSTYALSWTLAYTYGSYADLSGVSVKGGHPKGTAVYLNGVLLNQPQSSYADLSDVSPFLFPMVSVWEGGSTVYSIYGNVNFSYAEEERVYAFLENTGSISAGFKNPSWGVDVGRLTSGGRDTMLYAEYTLNFGRSFLDIRWSRKRTSGMEGFPQTSGLQTDGRFILSTPIADVLLLSREWNDWSGNYQHLNLRAGKGFSIGGYNLSLSVEGVKSTNVGSRLRPILSLSRGINLKNLFAYWGSWTDLKRVGYSGVFGVKFHPVYAQIGVSERIPSFDELYWEGAGARGNPDLKNERNFSLSAGFLGRNLRFTAFGRRVVNLIQWRPMSGVWSPENLSSARIWGGEIKIRWRGMLFRYTRMYAYDENGKRLIYRPRNSYAFFLSSGFGSFEFHTSLVYLDPRFTNRSNTRFVGYVLLVNSGVGVKLAAFSVSLDVFNLLDGRFYFVEGYRIPGRRFGLMAHYEF